MKRIKVVSLTLSVLFFISGCIATQRIEPLSRFEGYITMTFIDAVEGQRVPIYNAIVQIGENVAYTNPDGIFRIYNLQPGIYDINIETLFGSRTITNVKLPYDGKFIEEFVVPVSALHFCQTSGLYQPGVQSMPRRWTTYPTEERVIKYYVNDTKSTRKNGIKTAFDNLVNQNELRLRAEQTSKREDADIIFSWQKFDRSIVFQDNMVPYGPIRSGSEIIINEEHYPDHLLTMHMAVGIALGIKGTSDPTSIFYYQATGGQNFNLTHKDLNYLKALYSLSVNPFPTGLTCTPS